MILDDIYCIYPTIIHVGIHVPGLSGMSPTNTTRWLPPVLFVFYIRLATSFCIEHDLQQGISAQLEHLVQELEGEALTARRARGIFHTISSKHVNLWRRHDVGSSN